MRESDRTRGDQRAREDQRTRELRILNTIAEALNSSADVRAALERTLALVTDLLGLGTGWIWLIDPETGQFYNAASQNLPPYLQEPVRMTGRACWCIEDFEDGKLTPRNIDVMECSRLRPAVKANEEGLTHGLAYHATLPLYFQDKPLGILNVTAPAWREISADELGLLSTIAYQVGIAIERARLAEESARLARAEERARIAREIHDTLTQGLTGIILHLEGALHHLDHSPDRVRERMGRALETARASLEDARRSVENLRAAPLAGRPLADALHALGRGFTAETGIPVRVQVMGRRDLPLPVEGELFRITQEALANVLRHANAREVTITLRTSRPNARLVIRDDGEGFDPRKVSEGSHGLLGMRERARLLGGRLRVGSRLGGGTVITATIPLPEPDLRK